MTAQNSAAQNSTHQRLEDSPQIPWAKNAATGSTQAGGIRFENITKSYPSRTGEPTTVLQNLNLHIPAGQITVFVGPSGCGKTTSLRMINRMVEPNSGTITIDGVNVHEKNPYELRRGIGYVMQQGGLMPHRTVAQNIATVPRLLGAPARRRRREPSNCSTWSVWILRTPSATPPSFRAVRCSALVWRVLSPPMHPSC